MARAKKEGLPITCEVTPHHLFLSEDMITRTNYNANLKMNPPLRSRTDCVALQEALIDGTIDIVATDHAPHAPHEKEIEFSQAAFGSIGLETALSLVLSGLVLDGSTLKFETFNNDEHHGDNGEHHASAAANNDEHHGGAL